MSRKSRPQNVRCQRLSWVVNSVYYGLKACICIKVNDLRTRGRNKYDHIINIKSHEYVQSRRLYFCLR
jgi:hypothetical protein